MDVLDDQDVAAVVVELRIGISGHLGDAESRQRVAVANLEYRAYFPGREVEVVECQLEDHPPGRSKHCLEQCLSSPRKTAPARTGDHGMGIR